MLATDTNQRVGNERGVLPSGLPPQSGNLNSEFVATAVYIGERIDIRHLLKTKRVPAQQPAVIPLDHGFAFVYRYGAVVFFDVPVPDQLSFRRRLAEFVYQPYEHPETEELPIAIAGSNANEEINESAVLKDTSMERLQVVGAVLAKSVALAQYETDIAQNFERIEPFAVQLEQTGRGGRNMRQLLRHIGRALLDELKMVARVEVTDRPDLLWDHPDLAKLYRQLEDEFELQERAAILDRKLELISKTVSTVLDLLQKSRSMRVEWYIVFLIVTELAITCFQLLFHAA